MIHKFAYHQKEIQLIRREMDAYKPGKLQVVQLQNASVSLEEQKARIAKKIIAAKAELSIAMEVVDDLNRDMVDTAEQDMIDVATKLTETQSRVENETVFGATSARHTGDAWKTARPNWHFFHNMQLDIQLTLLQKRIT